MLITNLDNYSAKDLLLAYRNKDYAEKLFDNFKVELEGGRLRTKKEKTAKGNIFVTFIALIIYNYLVEKIRGHKKWNTPKMLMSLSNLKINSMEDGKLYLTEITKKNRLLFELFQVQIPSLEDN